MAAYHFADGDGHVGNDAMTIPDYVAIGLLLLMLLAAAQSFALPPKADIGEPLAALGSR
jgi:hypothetical protein